MWVERIQKVIQPSSYPPTESEKIGASIHIYLTVPEFVSTPISAQEWQFHLISTNTTGIHVGY